MKKCPNCGSTAQVKRLGCGISRNERFLTINYECGCGCHFFVDYEFGENDHLEKYAEDIEYIERLEDF